MKLVDILSEAEVAKCPAPTQNIELNLQNRQKAINEYGYGPLNPNEPNNNNGVVLASDICEPSGKM